MEFLKTFYRSLLEYFCLETAKDNEDLKLPPDFGNEMDRLRVRLSYHEGVYGEGQMARARAFISLRDRVYEKRLEK